MLETSYGKRFCNSFLLSSSRKNVLISLSLGSLRSLPKLLFCLDCSFGNILTIDNFWKRKILILNWCCMCRRNGELVDHLLIHCPFAFDLWSMVFTLFGIHWVMPKTVVELVACRQGKFGRHRNSAIWMVVPYCLMWCIWRERNNRRFGDLERSISNLKLFFLKTLLNWVAVLGFYSFSLG